MTKTGNIAHAGARLEIADEALRAALAGALAQGGGRKPLLVLDAAERADALAPDARALSQAQDFAAHLTEGEDACIVLLAGPRGPDRDALEGVVRALARRLAPVRVNALAPTRAGATLDPAQAGAALVYLATAPAVTGQVMEIGAPD
jgi:hypothetical protein